MDKTSIAAGFTVNGRAYACGAEPYAAICLDGSADDYLNAAMTRGLMPNLQRMCVQGSRGLARAAMPTFTNVNNSSIVTGAPPSVHGIGGNFFFDTASGKEVMMNSADFLRAPTIFSAAQKAGRKVGVMTAKEKLRDIFGRDLVPAGGIAFSSEKASQAKKATHGIENVEPLVGEPTPPIYSGAASLYVLKAGVALLKAGLADFLYLSTTDYIQHKAGPEDALALEFYAGIDAEIGRLLELGAVVGFTADHGMNAKQKADGTPNVIYLESKLTEKFGSGFRVILPITDPYVAHHGALGSFAQIHTPASVSLDSIIEFLLGLNGVTEVWRRAEAAKKLELPEDRMGELVVCSGRDVVLGRTPEYHDLSGLDAPLRSHGGRYEEIVPFIFSRPLNAPYRQRMKGDPRNFELFDFLTNGTRA